MVMHFKSLRMQLFAKCVRVKVYVIVQIKQEGYGLTGLAAGNMAANNPRILSLEHSANTCSCRGPRAVFSWSLNASRFSEVGDVIVSPLDSKTETKNIRNKCYNRIHEAAK